MTASGDTTLTALYRRRLAELGLAPDPDQLPVVDELHRLAVELARPAPSRWRAWRRKPPPAVGGLYVWGGVGRGKTWLMDLFHDHLDGVARGRLHFHRFMQLVHAELASVRGRTDPLRIIGTRLARRWRVLCLDEFNVVDIADAVILAGLLRSLFDAGLVLVTTSNVPPGDLYRDGIQRASFLPAIDLLNRRTRVLHLGGERDFRRGVLQAQRVFHTPLGAAAEAALQAEFRRLGCGASDGPGDLQINGRPIPYRRRAGDVVWFDFEALCGPPRSQADYIEVARGYQTVFISDVPVMGAARDDRTRRFVFLVDEFYDRRVKLVLSAAAPPGRLYTGERLAFEFRRTASRLEEMQAPAFLGLPHLG